MIYYISVYLLMGVFFAAWRLTSEDYFNGKRIKDFQEVILSSGGSFATHIIVAFVQFIALLIVIFLWLPIIVLNYIIGFFESHVDKKSNF